MRKTRIGAAAISMLLAFVFVASAQAVPTSFTTSDVTSPADGSLQFQNLDTNPSQTFTVSGTTNWASPESNLFDIGCYSGTTDYHQYEGTPTSGSGPGLTLNSDGSFSVTVPESFFTSGTCHLVVVPHGTPTNSLPGGFTGPRVGFSYFQSRSNSNYLTSQGTPFDYDFDDVTPLASTNGDSIDDCGPYTYLVDGTSAMNLSPDLFYCAGSFYNSANAFSSLTAPDLNRSEIEVDGRNAYGSVSADGLFSGSDALPGFPALSASVDSFDSSTGNAQTTESESLVKCSPEPDNLYAPTASDCTAFASTGVALKRVTDYSDNGRVATVTDTFSSTDGQAHALDLEYETDLNNSTAGWELPGQTSFTTPSTGGTGAPSTAPGTVYAIYDAGSAPSLDNPVGALTFATPYNSMTFDDTLWSSSDEVSALFDYQRMVPAGGSTSITWSYATGTSLAEVQGDAAAEQAELRPVVSITSPVNGAKVTKSPVTVTGTAGGGSGVKSVTVNNVSATVSGANWTASVPLSHGTNTLTATMTTDDGSTATATATLAYAPPPRISVKSKRFNGKAVLVKLACAASGSACAGKITVRYTETVVKHHKKHKVAVVVASKGYALNYGRTATFTASLNGAGRRLLKAHGKLAVKGTVTTSQFGHTKTGATFSLTLKQPIKHK